MSMDAKRNTRVRVTEYLRNHLRGHTVIEHETGRSLAQIVKPDPGEIGSLQSFCEIPLQISFA